MSLVCIALTVALYYDDIKNRGGALDRVYKDDEQEEKEKDSGSSGSTSEEEPFKREELQAA